MTEREFDHASPGADQTRMAVLAVGFILAVAAVARFWALGSGLPFSVSVDEPQIMSRAVNMLRTGDANPHFFDYPGFYIYLQAALAGLRFLVGASAGEWSSLAQVTQYDFYLWGRALTATMGTATVYLVYRIGMRLSLHHALFAAGLFALSPFHVRESHFVLTDVPMAFFVALAMLLSLRAHEKPTVAAFCWAGIASGLAAGTKYTGWISILLPLVAMVMTTGSIESRLKGGLAALGAFVGAFLVVAPYTVLDLPAFLNGFAAMASAYPRRGPGVESGWFVYFMHLQRGFGWPAMILAGVGVTLFAARLARDTNRARFAMVLLFLLAFSSMIADRTLIYARYMMPALPFVCLLISAGVVFTARLLRHKAIPNTVGTILIACVVAAALGGPVTAAITFNRDHGRRTTYADAAEWIQKNVAPGARIIHEAGALQFAEGRYEIRHVHTLAVRNVDYYVRRTARADYVIASSMAFGKAFSDPARYPEEFLFYSTLFQRLVPAAVVTPSRNTVGPELRIFIVPN